MSHGSELKGAAARALRKAGYKPCPRWWLTQDQLDLVQYMWRQNEAAVQEIRQRANDIERAWRAVRNE